MAVVNSVSVRITSFNNPFSFFCVINKSSKEFPSLETCKSDVAHTSSKKTISDVNHGQYVAVMWKNKWTRGVVTLESQFLIWLVDYGIYIHPDDKTICIELPNEYRKHPTKVFEAAIHSVVPLDKYISDDCHIENKISKSWNKGAIDKCQELIKASTNIYFVPLALMSTKFNDVVLGDLYLDIPGKKIRNIIDELELWPVFLERNKPAYVANIWKYFITRRKHRACILKPDFGSAKLPEINLELSIEEYNCLIKNQSDASSRKDCTEDSVDGASETETEVQDRKHKNSYKLTAAEIEKYSKLYITVHGVEYNVLNVLVNKARDLRLCERYKDLKSVGRGFSFRRSGTDDSF